jgi:hypothetical protein
MHLVPELPRDDGLVLARVSCAFVHGITHIDAIGKELVEPALVDGLA